MSSLFWIILALLIAIAIVFTVWISKNKRTSLDEIKTGSSDASLTIEALEERLHDEPKSKKNLKLAGKIAIDVLLGCLLAFFFLSMLNRVFSTGVFPYTTLVVATGSMASKNEENTYLFENDLNDQIQVNDLVTVKKIESLDEIQLYDIICYINEDGEQIIHRVIEKHDDYVVTRGDANNASDASDGGSTLHVTLEDIVGKYTHFRIPKIGVLIFFVQSDYGIACFVALFYFLILYDYSSNKIKEAETERKEALLSLIGDRVSFTLYAIDGVVEADKGTYQLKEEKREEKATYLVDVDEQKHELVAESK